MRNLRLVAPLAITYLGGGEGSGAARIYEFNYYAIPIGGGFSLPPDRIVCDPPPLKVNLFVFCKGSLIYKIKVWGEAIVFDF